MHFGVDYYPEHWPKDRWKKDAKMMKEARFDTVRLAEFAWSKLERTEGEFDFSWLDEAIDLLAQQGLEVVLGTPTAAPPPWLTEKHPEVLPVNRDKEIVKPGHRKHYCVNSKIYRDYTRRIVSKLADKYGEDQRVIGWQTDNELGHPVCYCDECREKFHSWLREKYDSLEDLNRSWGTAFWSHEYTDWGQIPLPNDNPRLGPNPSLHLDYKRFFSSSTIEYNRLQVEALEEGIGAQWICHNFMPHFPGFDHFEMAKDLDLATWDHYPTELRDSYYRVSAGHDLTYGFKDQPFWVMEEQCSYLTREELTPQPRPGETRMWTYQSIAHGASGIIYFRWRPCRFGDEQFHGGVLRHDGSRESPAYQEVKRVGKELEEMETAIDGTEVNSDVGLLFSFEQNWSMETYRFHSPLDYMEEIMSYYRALFDANINVKFVSPEQNFEDLTLLIAPVLPMVNGPLEEKLKDYVKGGGRLVGTFRSGIKNYENVITDMTFPGRLSDLFGIEVQDFSPLQENQRVRLSGFNDSEREYEASSWVDCIETNQAKTIASYSQGWPADQGYSGVTVNEYGDGKAYYVGLSGEADLYQDLIEILMSDTGLEPILESDVNVEVTTRSDPGGNVKLTFAINHASRKKSVCLDGECRDLITGETKSGEVELEPFGVLVLRRSKAAG